MGIGTSGDDTSADVVSYTNVGLTNLQLTGLKLDVAIKEINNINAYSIGFTVLECIFKLCFL